MGDARRAIRRPCVAARLSGDAVRGVPPRRHPGPRAQSLLPAATLRAAQDATAGLSGSFAPGRRRYQRMNCLMTVARSESRVPVAASRSAQSSSLTLTDRCCVPGLFGTRPSLPAVRTDFNGTPLRCTYGEGTVVYVHRASLRGVQMIDQPTAASPAAASCAGPRASPGVLTAGAPRRPPGSRRSPRTSRPGRSPGPLTDRGRRGRADLRAVSSKGDVTYPVTAKGQCNCLAALRTGRADRCYHVAAARMVAVA